MKLLLDKDINTDFVRYKVARRLEKNPNPLKDFEACLVDIYIHEYSNYENLMWSFWKRDKEFCLKEMDSLLMQISNIDRELTRQCIKTSKRYENRYEEHHYKAQFVQTREDMNMSLMGRVA